MSRAIRAWPSRSSIAQRLLDPGQPLPVERAAALQRVAQGQALVVVRDQGDLGTDRGPDPADRLEVVGGPVPAHPDLQRGEPALGQQFQRLVGDRGGRDEAQAVAVVGGDRLQGAAQEPGQRQPGRLGQGVPQRDVQAGHRGQGQALVTGQREPAPGLRERLARRGRPAPQPRTQLIQDRAQSRRRTGQVRGQVAVAGDALFRGDVDEQQRPPGEVPHLGGQWPAERHHHRPDDHIPHDKLRVRSAHLVPSPARPRPGPRRVILSTKPGPAQPPR